MQDNYQLPVAFFFSAFIIDGVAKSPTYGVMLVFQDLDLPDAGLRP